MVRSTADASDSSSSAAINDAKAFLLQTDANGHNLYDHLSEVLLKVLEHRPDNALLNLENISAEVKVATSLPSSDGLPDKSTELDGSAAASTLQLFKVTVVSSTLIVNADRHYSGRITHSSQ